MKKLIVIALLLCVNIFAAPSVGDSAVEFDLPELYNQNKILNSQALQGKVVLLNLWASWCSGCQEEMPLFVDLQEKYSKNNFVIVTSSIDNVAQSARDFLDRVDKEKQLVSLYDAKKILPKTYRCPGMPSSFLIDKSGTISEVYVGSLDNKAMGELKVKIDKLLGE